MIFAEFSTHNPTAVHGFGPVFHRLAGAPDPGLAQKHAANGLNIPTDFNQLQESLRLETL